MGKNYLKPFYYIFILCVLGGGHAYATSWAWRSEDNLQESFSSFYDEGPGKQILILKLGGQHINLLSYFTSLEALASLLSL